MNLETSISFFSHHFIPSIFLKRDNRFTITCKFNNKKIKAYLPNPGRLWEILLPGRIVYLMKNQVSEKLKFNYVAIAALKDDEPILLHTHLSNHIFKYLIENNKIRFFEGYSVEKEEFSFNNCRFDFLLKKGIQKMIVEVKSCTLFSNGLAMFPDALTSRGTKHISLMAKLSEQRYKCAIVFIAHSRKVFAFLPDYHTDPYFAENLYKYKKKLIIKPIAINVFANLNEVKELIIPWNILKKEFKDRGSYLLIIQNNKTQFINIGNLGSINFKKGFYIYVGSAKRNLLSRLRRHNRFKKRIFWHIDYLLNKMKIYKIIPIVSSENLECELSKNLNKISDFLINKFGCSDCKCESHLFFMKDNPLNNSAFINILIYYRIERIASRLKLI